MTAQGVEPYCQDCGVQVGYVLAEDGRGFTHRPAQLRYGMNPPTVTIVCADCAPATTRKPCERRSNIMRTIYRYRLPAGEVVTLDLPGGAEVLSVGPPRDDPDGPLDLWALVNPAAANLSRTFRIYGTGHQVPEFNGRFIGTVSLYDGKLIFHVFEEIDGF